MKMANYILPAALMGLFCFATGLYAQGLKAEISKVKIPDNRQPVVTFKLSDSKGEPIELSDMDEGRMRFTIAVLRVGKNLETSYHNYVLSKVAGKDYTYKGERKKPVLAETLQPDYDRGGKFARVSKGIYTYTFKTSLPLNFDKKATHVVGGEFTRGNRKYVANALHEFIPAGGKIQFRREVVQTASCNSCHDPLKFHGDARRETGYCALCHTAQLTDPETGHNLEFKSLIHKVHQGKSLPSVKAGKPFYAVGFRQEVYDFSTIGFPQLMSTDGQIGHLHKCTSCHAGQQAENWKTAASISACTSCHDNVDLKSGAGHAAGPSPDGSCAACHQPDGSELGLSIAGAHMAPVLSSYLQGVVFDILKVEGGKPGESLVVTFSLKNKQGKPLEASNMDNLRLVVAWPTVDYRVVQEEDVRKAKPSGDGVYVYRFKYVIPPDAKGSGAIGIQGYRLTDIERTNGKVIKGVRDAGFNVVKYFSITDSKPVSRRQVVKTESCNVCHNRLALHGEARFNTEYCVMCHHPSQTDEVKRKRANGPLPPENVHFKRLIHKIHSGEQLGVPFVVYGGPPNKPQPIDLSHIRYPGNRRNCNKCHEKGTSELRLAEVPLPTAIPLRDGGNLAMPPMTASCVDCHNKEAAATHMETQSASGGRESCIICHGPGRQFAVEKVHAR